MNNFYCKETSLHSYAVKKKSKGKKYVLALATIPSLLGRTKNDKQKPTILKFYDFTKVGTAIMDQRMTSYILPIRSLSAGRKSVCLHIRYSIRANAQTLWSQNTGSQMPLVLVSLLHTLVKPVIEIRCTRYLPKTHRNKVDGIAQCIR